MEVNQIRESIEQISQVVEQSYRAQAGGASLCQLHKDGRVTGGVKYDEGRLVALNFLKRVIRTKPQNDWRAAVEAELAVWSRALVSDQARTPPAIQWVAYRQGGMDILAWAEGLLKNC